MNSDPHAFISDFPDFDTACPVLLFKATPGAIHHGALGIVRSFGRVRVPVYAIWDAVSTPLAFSRYIEKVFIWKSWPSQNDALKRICDIGNTIGHRPILLPIDDLSAVFVAENSTKLADSFRFPPVKAGLTRELANKATLYSLCERLNIPCPRTQTPRSDQDVEQFIKNVSLPIVVKATEQWHLLNEHQNVAVIRTEKALLKFCKNVGYLDPPTMILQEYIPGDDWIYHGYRDHASGLCLSYTGRKLMSYPINAGSTAIGVSFHNEDLSSRSEALISSVCYSGITDMDWRLDKRDGQYKLLDCNPRVGQNFRMFHNRCGVDVVRAQHLNLTGRTVPCSRMVQGRLFKVESYCVLSAARQAVAAIRQPFIARSKVKRRLDYERAEHESAWWSADDPLPAVAMAIRLIVRIAGRFFGAIFRRLTTFGST